MSHMINLVRVLTAATGNSTPITLGAAYSQLFMTPAEAGAMDGRTYTYLIVDGNNFELGKGVYTASGTTLSRNVLQSRISGTLGTTRLSLSGTAQVRIIDASEDKGSIRGTRPVTGTSDVLMNSDLNQVVTYSNASAVAVSLAQAGASNAFLDGWLVWVKNKGVGAVTITPATSTIDAVTTLVLQQNQGALIWSDGTNYQSLKFRGDLGTAATKNVGTTAGTVAAGDDARLTLPSIQTILSGSGTYTTPAGARRLKIRIVGGGGGGGGSSSVGNGGTGTSGGTTTFGTSLLTATGGTGGTNGNPSTGGNGGSATVTLPAVSILALAGGIGGGGQAGGTGGINYIAGAGAASPLGGAGQARAHSGSSLAGYPAVTNSGSGGGGSPCATASFFSGGGGGSGGYVEALIDSPASTYSYALGAGGAGGIAGTSGAAGGDGGSGLIVVEAMF